MRETAFDAFLAAEDADAGDVELHRWCDDGGPAPFTFKDFASDVGVSVDGLRLGAVFFAAQLFRGASAEVRRMLPSAVMRYLEARFGRRFRRGGRDA